MSTVSYTVTYLEMNAAPVRTPPPRPAEPLALMAAPEPPMHFFLYLYRTVGAPYNWTDLLEWPEQELQAWVQDPAVSLHVLYRAGTPGGFYMLDRREAGVCELAYFGLTPESVGRRIGPWLLWTAIQDAWSAPQAQKGAPPPAPIEKVTVHTNTLDHPAALGLYQRMGFSPVRREQRTREV